MAPTDGQTAATPRAGASNAAAVSTAAATAPEDTLDKCGQCFRVLAPLTSAHLQATGVLRCTCCERGLPGAFFSNTQRGKAATRRCTGCLGRVGNESKRPIDKEKSRLERRLIRLQGELEAARKNHDEFQIKRTEKRLAKWRAGLGEVQNSKDKEAPEFRKRVIQYKFAVRAHKAAEKGLGDSPSVEFVEQLTKEAATLKRVADQLKQENSALFEDEMRHKVKIGKKKLRPQTTPIDADEPHSTL